MSRPVGQRVLSALPYFNGTNDTRLSDLFDKLKDVPRDELINTLKQLARNGDVYLVPDPDRRNLSDRQRAASFMFGAEPVHLISKRAR